ncbi:MAG TPA: serpin family protein [Myxococcales bacterium]|jgi:serpin B
MKTRSMFQKTLLATALVGLASCGGQNKPDPTPWEEQAKSELTRNTSPTVPAAEAQALIDGNTAFAANLFKTTAKAENAMVSPHSVSLALAMTWAGAKGETETAIAKAMRFDLSQDKFHPAFDALDLALASRGQNAQGKDGKPFRLKISNAAWGEQTFDFVPAYLDTLAVNYGAGINLVDFVSQPEDARLTINDWVAQQTEDRIKDLLSPGSVDGSTRLVLTNAVYFNAAWKTKFEANATHPAAFHKADGSAVDVDTMYGDIGGKYGETADFVAAELPYDGDEIAMTLVMPKAGTLADYEAGLDGEKLKAIVAALRSETLLINLPKFGFEWKTSLAQALSGMGMGIAFTDAADFSGIHAGGGLLISDVIHQTFVKVDEAGTEAAAATAVVVGTTSMPVGQSVTFDRPFLFLIRDVQTGAVLFVGHVYDPK